MTTPTEREALIVLIRQIVGKMRTVFDEDLCLPLQQAADMLAADAQPKTLLQERAQLEQEWRGLQALKRAQQVAVPQGEAVRYCYECGSIGEVSEGKRDCCPDGSHAKYVHPVIAEQAQGGLNAMLSTAPQPPQAERVPMTEDEIMDGTREECEQFRWPSSAIAIVRVAEAHHRIGA